MDLAAAVQRTKDIFIYFQTCMFQNSEVHMERECACVSVKSVLQMQSFRCWYLNGIQNWELGIWVKTSFLSLAF